MESIQVPKIFVDMGSYGFAGTWVIQVFVIVFTVLLFNFLVSLLLRRLAKKAQQSMNPWDDAFVHAVQKPLQVMIWVIGVLFAADIVAGKTGAEIFKAIDPVRNVSVILILTWFLIRFVKEFEKAYIRQRSEKGRSVDITTSNALVKLINASIFITAALVMLQTLGFSISGILAFGGIGGIAIGFAAKDLLSNFFGGLMIYLDRPFKVGDWICSPDKEIEGTVEEIGWRQTRICTFSKRPLYVPNSIFTSIIVENPSRMSHRRIYETIGIRYNDLHEMDAIVNEVKQMLTQHDEIDKKQTMIVNFNQFSDSSVDFFVYTFTNTTNWIRFHEVKQDVLLKISAIIEDHHASIAYPTHVLHFDNADDTVSPPKP
ncbi:MAG: mechanosensitive ion channel family protein [Gammaproteobacteria bacterium]|nr:mechanosensitive ion channel family protein [Gammaproteobacteria bacterium]